MALVEDFWAAKKISQTYKFLDVIKNVIDGKCISEEHIKFIYNEIKYKVGFYMFFNFKKAKSSGHYPAVKDTLTVDKIELDYIDMSVKPPRSFIIYCDDEIRDADLSDMQDPISKAARLSNYVIKKLYNCKI